MAAGVSIEYRINTREEHRYKKTADSCSWKTKDDRKNR